MKQLEILSLTLFLLIASMPAKLAAQQLTAIIDTSKGVIEVELNARAAPTSVANFVNLATRGFYDGLTFHRVVRNFMIQGGDPDGNGTGGPGYRFSGETILHHNRPGVISMANSGPGTDGSQFFITHVATPHLDGLHSVFGRVTSGLNLVYEIRRGDVINNVTIVGESAAVLERRRAQVEEWNSILDEGFPALRPSFLVN